MNPADLLQVLSLLLLIALAGAALIACGALADLLLPRLIARSGAILLAAPRRTMAVGLVNALFFGVLVAALGSGGELARLLSLLMLTVALALATVGVTAIARIVGDRLRPAAGPYQRLASGFGLLVGASLLPVVGWVAVAGLTLIAGLGAAIVALLRREPANAHRVEARTDA